MSHGVKISNLPHSVTEHSIREFLTKATTDIKSIRIKGNTAKVFLDEDDVDSVAIFDGSELDGSTIVIEKLEGSSKSSSNKAKSKSSSGSEGKKKKSKVKESKVEVSEPEILATDVSHSSFVPSYEAPSTVNETEAEEEREKEERRKRREERRLRRAAEKAAEEAHLEATVELIESEVTEDSSKKEEKHRISEELKAEEPVIYESKPKIIEHHVKETKEPAIHESKPEIYEHHGKETKEPAIHESKPEIIEHHVKETKTEYVESKIQSDESREIRDSSKKVKKEKKHEESVSVEVKHEVVESSKHSKVESSKHEIVESVKHDKISEKIETHEKSHYEEKNVHHQPHGHVEKKSTKIESVEELKKALHGVSLDSRSHLPYNDSFKFVTEYNAATFIVLLALIVLTFSDLVN